VSTIELRVMRLPHGADLPLPDYQSLQAAGIDLLAATPSDQPVVIAPGGRVSIPTGIAIALPAGTEAQVRPRSGLARKYGVTVLNAPGTIDADYRGELSVIVMNAGRDPITLRRGDRIAQMVVAPVANARFLEVDTLDETSRGAGGFGHTGQGREAAEGGSNP
jgi:dUTP pyrophosphatase